MKIYQYILPLLFLVVGHSQVEAQRIVRSTICSTGNTFSNSTAKLRSTVGQCPGCEKIGNGTTTVYQGFQQPVFSESTTDPVGVPCFQSDFVVEMLESECGTLYSFEYTGNADQEISNFVWDFGDDALPSTAVVANPQNIAFTSTGFKMVSLTVSQDTCSETVRKRVDITGTHFGADYTINDILCAGDVNGQIALNIVDGTEPYQILWEDGAVGSIRNELSAGDYPFTIIDNRGCEFSNVAVIQGVGNDSLSVLGTITNSSGTTEADGSILIEVMGGSSPYLFNWSDGNISQNRADLLSGVYELTVTDINGCTTTITFDFATLEGGGGLEIVPESVFTPNGDNINDTWIVKDIVEFPESEILVFNRWGQMVYAVDGYSNDWTGTNSDGEDLQTGAYWYIIKLNNAGDNMFSGVVTIVR